MYFLNVAAALAKSPQMWIVVSGGDILRKAYETALWEAVQSLSECLLAPLIYNIIFLHYFIPFLSSMDAPI